MSVPNDIRKVLEWCFRELDSDSSGFIEQQEGLMTAKYTGARDCGAAWAEMLKDMDTNGDGKVSAEEYVVWMHKHKCMSYALACDFKQELSSKMSQHAALASVANEAVDDLDLEEVPLDGSVLPAKPTLPTGAKLKALQERFKALDNDGDGSITKAELEDFHAMLDEEQVASLFAAADVDGSGTVTFDEFCKVIEAFDKAAAAEDAAMDGLLPE